MFPTPPQLKPLLFGSWSVTENTPKVVPSEKKNVSIDIIPLTIDIFHKLI